MSDKRIPIYFCIDTILDTRLGTLAKLDDDYAFYALMSGYMDRWTDDPAAYLPAVDSATFAEAYAKRDVNTLKISFPTDHALDAHEIITDLEVRHSAGDPTVPYLTVVHVNYYPYVLNAEQVVEFTKVIRTILKCRSEVKLFSLPTERLTTDFFGQGEYGAVYMYNYKEWIETVITDRINRGEQFKPCPEVTFYLPALTSDASAPDVYAECERELGQIPDACENLKLFCSRYFGLEWVTPTYYSISPSILFPKEKQKVPEERKDEVAEKYLFDKNNPNDMAAIRSDGED